MIIPCSGSVPVRLRVGFRPQENAVFRLAAVTWMVLYGDAFERVWLMIYGANVVKVVSPSCSFTGISCDILGYTLTCNASFDMSYSFEWSVYTIQGLVIETWVG